MKTYKLINNYQFSQSAILGRGSYGIVYQATNIQNGQVVAIKVIDRKLIIKEETKLQVEQETQIMKKFQHPNIVKLIDVVETINNKYIVSEYCNGSDLREYLREKKFLKEVEAILILKDIVAGLKEMVTQNIIHRDLKPANIIRHDNQYKITDFGFSRSVERVQMMESLVGTPLYMAPQILIKSNYSNKCDIWSLGMLYYEMLYGATPWTATSIEELVHNLTTLTLQFPVDKNISIQSKQFLRQCLQINEEQRFDWDQVFNHSIIVTSMQKLQPTTNNLKQMILDKKQSQCDKIIEKISPTIKEIITQDVIQLPSITKNSRERSSTDYVQKIEKLKLKKNKLVIQEVTSYGSSQSTLQNSSQNPPQDEKKIPEVKRPQSRIFRDFYLPYPKPTKITEGMRRTRSQLDCMPTISKISVDIDMKTMQRVLTNKNSNQAKNQRNLRNIFDYTSKIGAKINQQTAQNCDPNPQDYSKVLVVKLISKIEYILNITPCVGKIDTLNFLANHRAIFLQRMQVFNFIWETAIKTINDLLRQLKLINNDKARLSILLLTPYLRLLKQQKDQKENTLVILDSTQIQEIENMFKIIANSSNKENKVY